VATADATNPRRQARNSFVDPSAAFLKAAKENVKVTKCQFKTTKNTIVEFSTMRYPLNMH